MTEEPALPVILMPPAEVAELADLAVLQQATAVPRQTAETAAQEKITLHILALVLGKMGGLAAVAEAVETKTGAL